jgi:NAD(P)-dependent dehydrogenase (short-subunit alcohol dehydrogenase family)
VTASGTQDLFDLTGRVAVITGGGGDIAAVYARAMADAGAAVVLADLEVSKADAAASKLESDGFRAMAVQLDVTDPESAANMAASTIERFGGIDILVNNAAIMTDLPPYTFLDLPPDWFMRIVGVNVMGAQICTRAVVHSMLERGGGRIVNGSSAGAFMRGGIYSLTKYALHSLTATLATELGPKGINVNSIAPGLIDSDSGYVQLPKDSPLRGHLEAGIPGKKAGPPSDLVGTLLLLCSKAGDWINGQTISVDGGWIMRL